MAAKPGKAKEQAPKRRELRTDEFLRYDFTKEERTELADKLARSTQARGEAEESKKAVVAQFAEKIANEMANCSRYARLLTNGFEMRTIPCVTVFNTPKDGLKTVTRLDTGEVIREDKMTAEEKQEPLFDDSGEDPRT